MSVEKSRLPVVSQEVPLRAMKGLGVRRTGGLTTPLVEVHENEEVLTGEGHSDVFTRVRESF